MNCTKHLIGAALLTLGMTLSAQTLKPVTDDTPEAPAPVKQEAAAKPEVPAPVKQEAAAKPEVQPKSADPSVAQVDAKLAKKKEAEEQNKAPEKPVKYKLSKLIPAVIITADYEMPRVFTQTARRELNVPYIMILGNAKDPAPETEMVFMAPKATKAVSLKAKDLSKFLAYLRARDVIILGNTDYVPAFYSLAIPGTSRKVVIADADWQVNAVKLSNVLNSGKIYDSYLKYEAARKADLEQKRAAYEKAEQEKAAAIEKARQLKHQVIEAEAN